MSKKGEAGTEPTSEPEKDESFAKALEKFASALDKRIEEAATTKLVHLRDQLERVTEEQA